MSKESLAMDGGPKAVTVDQDEMLRWPIFTAEDEQAVLRVIRDGDLSTHHVARELEEDYANYFGMKYALSLCNGTLGLLSAFYALGLKPYDEVIVPSATWWASAVPLLWLGAIPIFAESEAERGGLDPEDVRKKINNRTKAIVVVHLWGMPSKMTELLAISKEFGIPIVEDASHAHGAIWRGQKCGTLGDISVFSLQGHKLAPAGEGGILLTNNREYFEQAALLGDIMRVLELDPEKRRFAGTTFGIKTRIASMSAAIARVQFRHLDVRNEERNRNIEYLSRKLEQLDFETFLAPAHIQRVYFEFLIRPRGRLESVNIDSLIAALQAEGCIVAPCRYPLLHQQPLFTEGHFAELARLSPDQVPKYLATDLPRTARLNARMIRLPSFPRASEELLNQYVSAFRKVVESRVVREAHS